ncbi:MAG TPA: hypothetical protein PKI07_03475, partial [Verrucomicrobiota bacterium]|nr:hypothetical protein [Verrucomicrobiota bacterium]
MTSYSALLSWLDANKSFAARVGLTGRQPRVVTDNPTHSQTEKEKTQGPSNPKPLARPRRLMIKP